MDMTIPSRLDSLANTCIRNISENNYFIAAALKGFRNGIVYGARVRAPHAFVMMLLFGRGTVLERAGQIFQMTRQHAWNLGRFVFGYKILMGLLKQRFLLVDARNGTYKQWHSFVAAALVGYFVFGKDNGVNTQINLYLLSRIIYGLVKLATEKRLIPTPSFPTFPLFAAFVWGTVLWLFENHEQTLQKSLITSMTYLYHDSNYWRNFYDFILGEK